LKLPKAETSKSVVVIGGGPAGLKAALVADERGHRVTLLEKSRALDYLVGHIAASGVSVKTGLLATPEIVAALAPDAIIIAIGAEPTVPPIKGVNLPNVIQAIDAYPRIGAIKGKVVVIGGGSVGCELGLDLCAKARGTTIVEMTSEFAAQGNMHYRIALRQLMDKAAGLIRLSETRCVEITPKGVMVAPKDGTTRLLEADTVILATGFKSNRAAVESFYGIVPDTYLIGDAEAARNVVDATNAAYFIAANL
jgi:pyruvate/2-oxoglutarate dehydrogenase complex dihydrolipoamide dehydrogenase (E3) component